MATAIPPPAPSRPSWSSVPAQVLTIDKQVAVVGGGAALPGAELEYLVIVRNVSHGARHPRANRR